MKKVIIFLAIIVVIFGAIALLTNLSKEDYYANEITPDELEAVLAESGDQTVYFYSPECVHCQQTSPIVVPLAEEMGVDLKVYNVLEYEQGWNDYVLNATPTIIHFENGEEVNRIVGSNEEGAFKDWFEESVLN